MEKLKAVGAGLALLTAVVTLAGGLIGVPIWVTNVVAQEAEKAAEKAVEENLDRRLAPTVMEMRSVKSTLRQQLDFDMTRACMNDRPEDRCKQEAQHRRATWLYDDCVLAAADDDAELRACASIEPDSLPAWDP